MPTVYLKGNVVTDTTVVKGVDQTTAEVPSIPVLDWLMEQLENALNGQIDSTNIAASGVGTAQIADGAVTTAKVAAGTLTPANMADTVGQTYDGTYTGDGTTVNRVISVGFTPRWVHVFATSGTFYEFTAHAHGATTYYFARDNTGTVITSTADEQGIVTGGFKLGTSATGKFNTAATVYSVVAWK